MGTRPIKDFLNKIVCGDAVDVMRQIPDNSVDLIITSPPYNIKNSTGNGLKGYKKGRWGNAGLISGYSNHDDCMPHDEYVVWQRECLTEMMRLLKDDGSIFYNHKWRVQKGLLQDRHDIVDGFPVRQVIIWRRKGGINFNKGYFLPTYEVIYLIAKPQFKLTPKSNSYGDVWEFIQEMNNPHPAPFPVDLIERIVSSTYANIVLDPFMGSGTTAISAINFKRDYIGIDNSMEYCRMAEDRIKSHKAQPTLFDLNHDYKPEATIECSGLSLFMGECNKDDTQELVRRLDNTLYSRDEFNHARDNVDTESDPIERARLMFVLHNQSFSGLGGTWGYAIAADIYKINPPYRFQQKIKVLQAVHNRIKYVTIENLSFSEIIPKYSTPETLFYLDPPYCPTSRTGGAKYKHEMGFDEHVKMVEIMLGSDAMFILSGFDTEAYRPLEKAGYTRKEKTRAVMIDPKLTQHRTEVLWISPNIRRASLLPLFMENSLTSI